MFRNKIFDSCRDGLGVFFKEFIEFFKGLLVNDSKKYEDRSFEIIWKVS